jgi:replicative DNA helicase
METDFSSDLIEKLLLKQALTDKNWINILENLYDKRWFKVQNLGIVLKLVLNYYKKYNAIPNNLII